MRQIALLLLLFTFANFSLAYPPLSYPSVKDEIEYEPFKQTQKIKVNKTTTTTTIITPYDLPMCTPEDIPTSYAIKKAIKTSRIYISDSILTPAVDALKQFTSMINTLRQHTQTYISNSIVTPTVNILKQQFTPMIDILKHHTQLTIVHIKLESIKLKDNIKKGIKRNRFVSNSVDYIYVNIIQPVSNTIQSINMKIKNSNWLMMDNMDETKEKIVQTLEDVYLSPSLEWHLFLNKVNKKWMTFCRFLGIDSHVRHLHRELFLKNQQVVTTPHSHLDDIFKDMVETDYHSQFYQQQMTNYFKSLDFEQQVQVHYSKRDFIQWVKDGESMWHDFIDQMQHEWILLMQTLYQDFEKMVHCLFSTPPTTMNKITCSFKNGKGLSLLNSASSSTTRQFYEEQRQKNNKKNQNHLHLHFWQHELLMLSKELEKTAKCICSHTHDSSIPSSTTSSSFNMDNNDHLNIKSTATSKNDIHQQTLSNLSEDDRMASQKVISKYVPKQHLFLKKHPIQEVIDALTKLQKEKSKQFTRIDKHLQRLLFELTPPRSHQPIHLFYERLRDNASAMNKSTFNKYISQLLYSWNSIISTTLDITTTMIDDLKWLQEKQLLEKSSSSSTMDYNQQQQQEEQFKESLELIWTSSKRKLDKNNLQIIQHWESIFINMDIEIQEAWDNMLVMVDSSHRSAFQKVKQFWSENKSRLSNFFTNIFYSSTMEHID